MQVAHQLLGGRTGVVLDEGIVWVTTPFNLADLFVPENLGVVALKCPKSIGAQGELVHLDSPLARLLPLVQSLPELLVSLVRILHQSQYQILRKLHYEPHS